jgi:hypothetical protein
MIDNDKRSYNIGYNDGWRDAGQGIAMTDFAGLPKCYVDGYVAGQFAYILTRRNKKEVK